MVSLIERKPPGYGQYLPVTAYLPQKATLM